MKATHLIVLILLLVLIGVGIYALGVKKSNVQQNNNTDTMTSTAKLPDMNMPEAENVSDDAYVYIFNAAESITDPLSIQQAINDSFNGDRKAILNKQENQAALEFYRMGIRKDTKNTDYLYKLPSQTQYEALRSLRNLADLVILLALVQKENGQSGNAMNTLIDGIRLTEDMRLQAKGVSVPLIEGMIMMFRDRTWSVIGSLDSKTAQSCLKAFELIYKNALPPSKIENNYEYGILKDKALVIRKRNVCLNGMLLIELALQCYKSDDGSYPTKLSQLTPKYLSTIPKDPFVSTGYIYSAQKKSFKLYSIGADGKDDGGAKPVSSPNSPPQRLQGPDIVSGLG